MFELLELQNCLISSPHIFWQNVFLSLSCLKVEPDLRGLVFCLIIELHDCLLLCLFGGESPHTPIEAYKIFETWSWVTIVEQGWLELPATPNTNLYPIPVLFGYITRIPIRVFSYNESSTVYSLKQQFVSLHHMVLFFFLD